METFPRRSGACGSLWNGKNLKTQENVYDKGRKGKEKNVMDFTLKLMAKTKD